MLTTLIPVIHCDCQTEIEARGKNAMKQSKMNLDATLEFVKRDDGSNGDMSYYCLKVSQYVAQIIFSQPFLAFSSRGGIQGVR